MHDRDDRLHDGEVRSGHLPGVRPVLDAHPRRLETDTGAGAACAVIQVTVRTVRFDGSGIFTCRRCSTELRFPSTKSEVRLLSFDAGTVTLVDAWGGVVHACNREHFWWCDSEGIELDDDAVNLKRYGRRSQRSAEYPICVFCGGAARQRIRVKETRSTPPACG